MDSTKWMMSAGGPLIAMEANLQAQWGGVSRLTVAKSGAANDYDRPSHRLNFLQDINLQEGNALIFGEGPLDTTFWRSPAGTLFILLIIYCDPNFNAQTAMTSLDQHIFNNPLETLQFLFLSDVILMFDSAEDGLNSDKKYIASSVKPGQYHIVTQTHKPDANTSLVLHRFDKIS